MGYDTPFNDIIEVLYQNQCQWHILGTMWSIVSAALIEPHVQKRIEVVVNRGPKGVLNQNDEEGRKPMNESFFWLAEVPKLATTPLAGGLQFLAKQDVYPCRELMPNLKSYIESLDLG